MIQSRLGFLQLQDFQLDFRGPDEIPTKIRTEYSNPESNERGVIIVSNKMSAWMPYDV